MSTTSYDLNSKGVRLIDAQEAWVIGKNGKRILNPKYKMLGKINTDMPGLVVTASDTRKPKFVKDVCNLNLVAKGQIIEHFYDDKGKRNKKRVAYFGIKKKK